MNEDFTIWGAELWCCAVLTVLWPLDATVQYVTRVMSEMVKADDPEHMRALTNASLIACGQLASQFQAPIPSVVTSMIMAATVVLIRHSHLSRDEVQQVMQLVCFDTIHAVVRSPLWSEETGKFDQGAAVN